MSLQNDEGWVSDAVPVLRVSSVARSMKWYAHALAFTAEAVGPPEDPVFAILSRDDVEIMLQRVSTVVGPPRAAGLAGGGWDVYLRIDDAQAFREAVKAKVPEVGPIEVRPYGCKEFVLKDPDGHVIVLGECG